jgi:glycosyltransferase involved in cell wall biosynthesis
MAAGKAVICADEPGPDSELLVHEWNGLRFRRGDIEALAASMRALLDLDEFRQRLGDRAHETIRSKATLENMVNRFSTAVTSVLSDDRRKI